MDAPIDLQPIIAIMIDEQLDIKPNVKDLTYEVPGEVEGELLTLKVSADDRDAAWQWLQDADTAAEGEGE